MSTPIHIEELTSEAYEAELNAEVERLRVGDRNAKANAAAAQQTEESDAAGSSEASASAAAASSSAAAADSAAAAAAAPSSAAADSSSSRSSSPLPAATPLYIEEVFEKDLAKAVAAKVRGNNFFARQQYQAAVTEYTEAIERCPWTPNTPAPADADAATAAADAAATATAANDNNTNNENDDAATAVAVAASSSSSGTAEEKEHLAVFYSNRAAAYLMQHLYAETIADCTASLSLHPGGPKPLSRRAKAYEATDALAEALEDLKALVEIDPRDRESAAALQRVQKALNDKNEKMKAEMMDKLKGFGNSILGKFGMSLDNFKATQDPATGSYNISFGK